MMSVSVPSTASLEGAASLLAALADPKGTADRLAQLKAATETYNQAASAARAERAKLDDAMKALSEREAKVLQREQDLAALDTAATHREASIKDVEARSNQRLSERTKELAALEAKVQASATQLAANRAEAERLQKDSAAKLSAQATALAARETALAAREAAVKSAESNLAERQKQLRALID